MNWAELMNHSVAIAVLLFVGTTIRWYLKRTYGKDGTDTKLVEAQTQCELKNSETMAGNATTLVEIKNLAASQQELCRQHVGGLQQVGDELVQLNQGVQANRESAERFEVLYKSPRHYKTTYLVDLAGELIDTFARIAKKNGLDFDTDLESLRARITAVKHEMHEGDLP